MRKNKSDYKGIYSDMVEILGEEIVMKLHEHYRGQQITFPMKLYSNEYIEKYIVNNCRNKTLKEMCRDLGYTEGWIKQLLNKLNGSNKFYVAEGYNLLVLNESEENSALIKRFLEFLATNTEESIKYVKEGKFFSSYLSTYKNKSIEESIKNFSGKSPLVVMSNIYEKAPEINDYELYLEVKNKILGQ